MSGHARRGPATYPYEVMECSGDSTLCAAVKDMRGRARDFTSARISLAKRVDRLVFVPKGWPRERALEVGNVDHRPSGEGYVESYVMLGRPVGRVNDGGFEPVIKIVFRMYLCESVTPSIQESP